MEMKTQVLERLELGNQLRHAIDQRELSIYYQPQVDIVTGRVIGLEALLRWQHPTLGLLTPEKFLALAQDSGLIVPLGEWMLENVCAQINRWKEMELPTLVAVNISAREVKQKKLIQVVHKILSSLQTPPELLEFEVTESIVFQDVENMLPILHQLKNLGVRLAIDDFGTGYSSLGRLAQFPFDTLKIDKHFAPRENSLPSELIVVKGIVSIAKNLGLDVIAEGVETADQLAFYKSLNCTHIQGWYFSKALPAEEVEKYLRDGFPLNT
jgi:EAL domain-containing protein (putative c-di-GMP-specific phosphodiesterase class I)